MAVLCAAWLYFSIQFHMRPYIYTSVESACRSVIRTETATEPCTINRSAYEKFYGVYRTLYPSLQGAFAEVGRIMA